MQSLPQPVKGAQGGALKDRKGKGRKQCRRSLFKKGKKEQATLKIVKIVA
jgi:hypothetical protein